MLSKKIFLIVSLFALQPIISGDLRQPLIEMTTLSHSADMNTEPTSVHNMPSTASQPSKLRKILSASNPMNWQWKRISKDALHLLSIHSITFGVGIGSFQVQDDLFTPFTANAFAGTNQSEIFADLKLAVQLALHWIPAVVYYICAFEYLTPDVIAAMDPNTQAMLYGVQNNALLCGVSGINVLAKELSNLFGTHAFEVCKKLINRLPKEQLVKLLEIIVKRLAALEEAEKNKKIVLQHHN